VGKSKLAFRTRETLKDLFSRIPFRRRADVAQLAERVLGKDEVSGSIPLIGSRNLLGRHRQTAMLQTTQFCEDDEG
jgi:hypothetical protein